MDTFVARQPIFDRDQKVFGYELLFRSGVENVFRPTDPNRATSKVIVSSFFLLNFQTLTTGKRAFNNVTRDILIKEFLFLLPKDHIVVEILENVPPDEEVVAACEKLKAAGYLLAMDDFVYHDRYLPLLQLSDIIKVDFLATPKEVRQDLVQRLKPLGVAFLAEKIETQEMFDEALELGYTYCQGYFFSRPKIIAGKDIPGFKLNYLRLLQEIHRPELDFEKLEAIIRQEVSLSYKLLRYINSAFFGRKDKVSSLKQALLLLGEKETLKWLTLVILASMGEDKPEELVAQSIFRAKFCESLAPLAGLADRKESLFLLGLFSMIDALLDRPLADILAEIPIAEEIKGALLGEKNPLSKVFQYVLSYEKGEWDRLADVGFRRISEEKVSQLYLEAVRGF